MLFYRFLRLALNTLVQNSSSKGHSHDKFCPRKIVIRRFFADFGNAKKLKNSKKTIENGPHFLIFSILFMKLAVFMLSKPFENPSEKQKNEKKNEISCKNTMKVNFNFIRCVVKYDLKSTFFFMSFLHTFGAYRIQTPTKNNCLTGKVHEEKLITRRFFVLLYRTCSSFVWVTKMKNYLRFFHLHVRDFQFWGMKIVHFSFLRLSSMAKRLHGFELSPRFNFTFS